MITIFNPLVSIIIPVYNGANYLAEAIESAINQTYKNIEIIVVNDGSNDNGATREVALKYKDKIRYYEKENGGVASAFNYGIQKMTGEYFSWLSHDDIYCENKIEFQVDELCKLNKNTILFSDYYYINEKSEILGSSNLKIFNYRLLLLDIIFLKPFINGNTVLISKSAFNTVGLFDVTLLYTQDYDMWFRLANEFPFFFSKIELVKSRIHQNQGSKINKNFKNESLYIKYKQLLYMNMYDLNYFTNSSSLPKSLFKLSLIGYAHGGELNEYPLENLYEKFKIKYNIKINLVLLAFNFLLVKSLFLPNKVRRSLSSTILKCIGSVEMCRYVNAK